MLGISPTLVRSLMAAESDPLRQRGPEKRPTNQRLAARSRSVLTGTRPLNGTTSHRCEPSHQAETVNPAPWWWLFEKVGNSKVPIINYSGGTEISGGI